MSRSTLRSDDVQMAPGVLAWSPQRGPITSSRDLAAAVQSGEAVLRVTSDHAVRTGGDNAPLAAVVRLDNDLSALLQRLTELALEVDDLRIRLVDIAEHAAATLSGG
jgi:hypothetical protein